MRIMKIIRRTYSDNIQLFIGPFKLRVMPIKQFHLRKKSGIRKITIHNTDTVKFIVRGNKLIVCLFNSPEVTGSYIPGNSDYSKMSHTIIKIEQINYTKIRAPT